MDKVKVALTVLSIMIIIVPLVAEVYAYKDNLLGLVLPPQMKNLMNGGGNSGTSAGPQSSASPSLPNFQIPQPAGQPKYNPTTGAFTYPFNFTNPLSTEISFDHLSAQVVTEDGTSLGNISMPQTISIPPGANSVINASGNLNPDAVNQLAAQNTGGNLNIALNNVNVDVGGVLVHIDHIDAGSISNLQSLTGSPGGT
ncbi:MAG: hypothetical protein ABSF44_12885 [Candidatus Bathyarchaeia archaeon]|jgi:hypothetical protein